MNKQIYKIAGVTENDFKTWCKDTGRKAYKPESKTEFFARLADGRLVRDEKHISLSLNVGANNHGQHGDERYESSSITIFHSQNLSASTQTSDRTRRLDAR